LRKLQIISVLKSIHQSMFCFEKEHKKFCFSDDRNQDSVPFWDRIKGAPLIGMAVFLSVFQTPLYRLFLMNLLMDILNQFIIPSLNYDFKEK